MVTVPLWKDVLPPPPARGQLRELWMTSFERPDASLLVEHLLPSLLGTSHSLAPEIEERALFFGELGMALEALRGRLTIISSPSGSVREDAQYPWLWRYVSHFTVGAQSRAVQHAKLWVFHWKAGEEEHLELHVSSTNLTSSAFKAQVQAGWQIRLPLGEAASPRTRETWGMLVPFLDALGAAAGDVAAERIQRLVELLGRVQCPADVSFIASIPGQESAASQLKPFGPSELHVLTPTIGDWNDRTLEAWSKDVGVPKSCIHLKWISTQHPWAASSGWTLSSTAFKGLRRNGVQLECLPCEARLTEQHREADSRWSHAKLYLLCSRQTLQLLVTSANWSVAAWGAGRTAPRNFELGVLFESRWSDLEGLGVPVEQSDAEPYCVDRTDAEDRESALGWAEAGWDGEGIGLRARSSDSITPITAFVTFLGGTEKAISLCAGGASMLWDNPELTPITASFVQGEERLVVDVLDIRPPGHFSKTPLPELDPDLAQALRAAFLLHRYGGPDVDPPSIPRRIAHGRAGGDAPAADYSVKAWLDARAGFNVVDHWLAALAEAAPQPELAERVRLDGRELRSIFLSREELAFGLVAEELGWHLEEDL